MEIKRKTMCNIECTEEELDAIKDLIGHTSVNKRIDHGLSREQAELLSDVYKDIERETND